MFSLDDTIAAISTPPGAGGVGIVRLSGEEAPRILEEIFRRSQREPWQSHRLYYGRIIDPLSGALLDKAMAVLMTAPHSYTRQHVAELHCHGGGVVVAAVLKACLARGARLAERGEFTLRAFLNGALSLAEAEAVADLVSAKSSGGARLAAKQLDGALSALLLPLEQELLELLARLTVAVDFPDDADAPDYQSLLSSIEGLLAQVDELLAGAENGRVYREGYSVVLAGASNVGKSSLLNRLLASERAIVSAAPGTTRDIIEESLTLEGLPLVLRDTAGLRQAEDLDEAEQIGMERSRQALQTAQLVLVVIDAATGLDESARMLISQLEPQQLCLVLNKCDLLNEQQLSSLQQDIGSRFSLTQVAVSAKTGAGLPALQALLKQGALQALPERGREPLISNLRHQQALCRVKTSLLEAQKTLQAELPLDLATIDLENAWQALGEISGKTVSEEILSQIFENFCVGK